MLAALGGVVPFDGCVAFAGGFAGAGGAGGPGSFVPSDGAVGAAFAGGFTSLSWACCLGAVEGGAGTGGVCV